MSRSAKPSASPLVILSWFLISATVIGGRPLRAAEPAGKDWISVGGDRGCMRYSTLDEINRDNVSQLQAAWTFHTGELDEQGNGRTIECTPVVVDGTAYPRSNRRGVSSTRSI